MDTNGKLVPQARRIVYAPTVGEVLDFRVDAGDVVGENDTLAVLYSAELAQKLNTMQAAIDGALGEAAAATKNANRGGIGEAERINYTDQATMKAETAKIRKRELDNFIQRSNANPNLEFYGWYYLRAPMFAADEKARGIRPMWTVLNGNFKDEWWHKTARPSDPILKLGAKEGPWEIEARIPQKHVSQVLRAFEKIGENEALDVDFLLRSDPTRTYRGKLYKDKIASEAVPNRDEKDESEPEVIAYISIDDADIDTAYRLSRESLTSGTEVHAKIRCGKHPLGYSLFYGVWEFLYEKVVFFF